MTPCYWQEDGTYLDVVSAIHMGTIQNNLLIPIADAALKHLRRSYEAEKRPIEDGLYFQVINGTRRMKRAPDKKRQRSTVA